MKNLFTAANAAMLLVDHQIVNRRGIRTPSSG